MTTPWTAPKQEIAPGEYERALRDRARDLHHRLHSSDDKGEPRPDRTVRAPRNAFEGRMRDCEKSPYTDRTLKPSWRPIGQLVEEIILDLPKPK